MEQMEIEIDRDSILVDRIKEIAKKASTDIFGFTELMSHTRYNYYKEDYIYNYLMDTLKEFAKTLLEAERKAK